jgi:hypothetical protein
MDQVIGESLDFASAFAKALHQGERPPLFSAPII